MTTKNTQTLATTSGLTELITTWKINQASLAREMKMPIGTFKNKLKETNGLYRFTTAEFLQLASVIDRLMASCQTFLNNLDKSCDDLL